jgi:predicted negative regulator of RcsB-dependent stress response
MSNPPSAPIPTGKTPAGAPAENSSADLPFEMTLRAFWDKRENRNTLYGGLIAVLAIIVGWNAYQALAARHQAGIQASFAAAVTPGQLQTFVRENPGHPLAGAAWLKLGDEAYAAGRFAEAVGSYEQAIAALPGTPFAARARLGKAMCLVQSGKTSEGMTQLKQLADDTTQLTATRCEAASHLASLTFDSGDAEATARLCDLVMQLDGNGMWAQRAFLLRMRLPAPVDPPRSPRPRRQTRPPRPSP